VYQLSWTASVTAGPLLAGALLDVGSVALWSVFGGLALAGGSAMLLAERNLPTEALGRRTLDPC
jgi:hypothetical protein